MLKFEVFVKNDFFDLLDAESIMKWSYFKAVQLSHVYSIPGVPVQER